MGEERRFLTVSVDDGDLLDLRVAEALARHDLQATFYIPQHNLDRYVMPESEIRHLAARFEIGGHSRTHLPLTRLADEEISSELVSSKTWLEDLLERPVISFCYPHGKFNTRVAHHVENAGFLGARTGMLNLTEWPKNAFFWGVSSQAYSHSPAIQLRHALLEGNLAGTKNFVTTFRMARDWEAHFGHALDRVESRGGIAHLYLHGWEIEAQNAWHKLERAFAAAARRTALRRVTNGDLFRMHSQNTNSASPHSS
jgi:peptidoglycan/xylan/chitin deacetylase (PgdA/CDA1 family)